MLRGGTHFKKESAMKGTIKWFSGDRGYGFLLPAAGGADLFFHASQLCGLTEDECRPGTRVEFETSTVRADDSRPQAINVGPVQDDAPSMPVRFGEAA